MSKNESESPLLIVKCPPSGLTYEIFQDRIVWRCLGSVVRTIPIANVRLARYRRGVPFFYRPRIELDVEESVKTLKTIKLWLLGFQSKLTGSHRSAEDAKDLINKLALENPSASNI